MNRIHSLTFGTILLFATHTFAQQPATAPGSADKREQAQVTTQDVPTADFLLSVLTPKLDLTGDQQARIRPILQDLHDAMVKISQDQNLSDEERLAQVRPIHDKAHAQVLAILNDEQKKKLEQYMQGPHPEMHGKMSGPTS